MIRVAICVLVVTLQMQLAWALRSSMRLSCESDADCLRDYETCEMNQEAGAPGDGICIHKRAFPMLFVEFVGCFVISVALFVTQLGGIAGGGMMIPIMLFFFRFDV